MKVGLLFLLLLFYSNVFAYNFTSDFIQGLYWNSLPLRMKVVTSAGFPDVSSMVKNSMQEWESLTGLALWEDDESGIDGEVHWSSNFAQETGYDAKTTLAITSRYPNGTYIGRAVIILNGNFPALVNNVGGILTDTIIHELGHTIGLGHSDKYAIMQAYVGSITAPTSDDLIGMKAVYDETVWRQNNHYVSTNAATAATSDKSSSVPGCGAIVDMSKNGGGPSAGVQAASFAMMILIGLFSTRAIRKLTSVVELFSRI